MSFTKKHCQLALRNRWSGSQYQIFCYILQYVNPNQTTEIEFHIDKFQKYIKKHGGSPYDPTTIPKSLKQLEERSEGIFVILYDYSRGVYKILVHPISFLQQKKITEQESARNQNALNPMFSNERKEREAKQQQQFISKVDQLFKKIGLEFDQDALIRIWRLSGKSVELVVKTIEHFLDRNSRSRTPIENPYGFLIDSFRYRWAKNFDLYYQPEIPTFQNRMEISQFVSRAVEEILPDQIGKHRLSINQT